MQSRTSKAKMYSFSAILYFCRCSYSPNRKGMSEWIVAIKDIKDLKILLNLRSGTD